MTMETKTTVKRPVGAPKGNRNAAKRRTCDEIKAYLQPGLKQQLETEAKAAGKSQSEVVNEALRIWMYFAIDHRAQDQVIPPE
jgi:hypothetical protein